MSTRTFDILDSTVFEVIDAADVDGYVTFREASQWLRHEESVTKADAIRDLVESAFRPYHLFTLRLGQVKRWLKDIEATRVVEDNGDWTVRLNLARFFLLPCLSPREELAELRAFFESMKPFFEAHAQDSRPARITLMNNRDNNGRVYGSFGCTTDQKNDQPETAKAFDQAAAASPVLEHFVRQAALSLQKLGPWSWCPMAEEMFYGAHRGPWSQAFYEKCKTDPAK